MASVTQCDVCQGVVKHEKALLLLIKHMTSTRCIDYTMHSLEICPECYRKLCDVLNMEVKKSCAK